MDKDIYEHGQPPYGPPLSPDFCLGHWQTQCRATFEAPMDPNLILGGFPSGREFRNYSADATAFVVTYPVDSSEDNRCCPTLCCTFSLGKLLLGYFPSCDLAIGRASML